MNQSEICSSLIPDLMYGCNLIALVCWPIKPVWFQCKRRNKDIDFMWKEGSDQVVVSFTQDPPSWRVWREAKRVWQGCHVCCRPGRRRPTQRHEVSYSYISLFLPPAGLSIPPLSCHTLSLTPPFLRLAPSLMTLRLCANFQKIKEENSSCCIW